MKKNQRETDSPLSAQERALIESISRQHNLDADVVIQLLALGRDFPDIHAWGARSNLRRRVAQILANFKPTSPK